MGRAVIEIVLGCIVGLAIGGAVIWGVMKLGEYIVEHTHESYSHPIPNRSQACWTDGETPAVVSPAVAQVVWL